MELLRLKLFPHENPESQNTEIRSYGYNSRFHCYLLFKDPQTETLRHTQAIANLLFQFGGMPFVDLAHLEKSNLNQGLLKYNRMKTGTPMSVEIIRFRRQSTYLQKLQHGVVGTYEIQNQSIYRRIWRPMVRARLRKV